MIEGVGYDPSFALRRRFYFSVPVVSSLFLHGVAWIGVNVGVLTAPRSRPFVDSLPLCSLRFFALVLFPLRFALTFRSHFAFAFSTLPSPFRPYFRFAANPSQIS